MLEKLEEISSRTWGEEETSRYNSTLKKLQFKSSLASDDIHSNSSTQSPSQSQFGFSSSVNGSPPYDKITRPKSAAPQLTGGSSSPQGHSHGLGIFESQTDQSPSSLFEDFDIMKVGTRRSASTGVIGHGPTASSSVMDSLGLIPAHDTSTKKHTTFMDLIQEDFQSHLHHRQRFNKRLVISIKFLTVLPHPLIIPSHLEYINLNQMIVKH